MKAIHGLLAMLFLVAASLVNAADAPGATDTSTKPATLYRPRPVALGDIVAVTLKKQPCQSLAVVQKYRLLVNGAYTGIAAQGCQNVALPDGSTAGQIQFLLRKDSDPPAPETAAAWRTLIGEPWQGQGTPTEREIAFGVSDEAGNEIPVMDGTQTFRWSPVWKMIAGGAVFVAVIFIFVLLARQTALLRDVGSTTSVPLNRRTFSLARTQMAWWTLIIVGSYIYEWLASGVMPPLSAQALALMGIYSVLTVGSRSVDLARDTQFPPSVPRFFSDLVSDESGVAIHRLQMLIFTVIVGLMFVYQVLTTVSMPALEPYTLAVIGISGATYIGLKSTEPQPKPVDPAQPATPADTPASSNGIKSGYAEGDATQQAGAQEVEDDVKAAYSAG
ncbi:hypothetical protein [Paraburkholderia sp. J10-1]|uniref:hypothetical protein n=3 Tax=unclassified Paraburkholderia TaxID=2615204 RepID=UPI002AB6FD12|nr:hypothetical protein [Paraburkholderia sp. J10-1]